MFGLSALDLIVIGVYCALVVAIGLLGMRGVRDQEDFFLGGRRFGRVLQVFASFAQATSSEGAVGTVTTTYRDGVGGIWSHLVLIWATPLYWFAAPWYRRMRVLTLGDFFRERYQSPRLGMFYSVIASFVMVISIGLGLKAVSVTLMGLTLKPEAALSAPERTERAQALRLDELSRRQAQAALNAAEQGELQSLRDQKPRRELSYLKEAWIVWGAVLVVLASGLAGGLRAAIWAGTVQGTLILVLSVVLIPFAAAKLNARHGGTGWPATVTALHQELPGRFFSLLGSAQNADFTWYFVTVLALMMGLNVCVQSNQLTASASARDESAARIGSVSGALLKRGCTVLWGLTGLLAGALYGREIGNSDLVWGHATRDLLGGLGLGLVGLVIACLLAALQSTASSMMISASSLLTRNVYEPLVPTRSEAHYVRVGRVAGAAVLVASALLGTAYDSILALLKFYWEYNAIVAAAFWCGLKWRRATRAGAWAAVLTAFVLFLGLPLALPSIFPRMRTAERFLATTRERTVLQTYAASKRDVEERSREIHEWRGPGPPPARLEVGEKVVRPLVVAPRAIYWAQGIREVDGVQRGQGLFHVEMYTLGHLVDLTANPFALNETIRYGYKLGLPFLVLILVSLLTQPDDGEEVQQFFLRMRTKVHPDRATDAAALTAAYADPESTRARLLFPASQFELLKWDREDAVGFVLAGLAVIGLVALMSLGLKVGG